MLCRFRSAAVAALVLCASAQSLAAAQIVTGVSLCDRADLRIHAQQIGPHENPAGAMNHAAMQLCPSGYSIAQTQSSEDGRSLEWSIRCSVLDRPPPAFPRCS
jgi:hypothetical protein